ncbi:MULTISPECIES: enoyl-CoA hydratase-related protein [Rhodomicrobium]|uniref:enoyl-CoA hydratase-related protein n=1 Tax=Rhodomicrobium TaxID=1068 RepID=UPI000B4BBD23|nr:MULTISPECIES: enoyl-CoA hydratase-related protein [Rhodomicrobium]
MSEDILVKREDGVVEIRFNRPAKKNALTNAMYGIAADALEAAQKDAETKAILFTAEGDMFTAGNDLSDFAAIATGGEPRHVERFLRAIATAEKPLIAAVTGNGVGVGATMLLHCDIVIMAEEARLSTPFTALGLTPEAASSLLLPARIGHARAFMMLALGQPMSGTEAAQAGLATEAAPREEVEARARKLAREVCLRPAEAMRITKKLLRDVEAIGARMQVEGAHFNDRLRSPEARAAFEAFFKR